MQTIKQRSRGHSKVYGLLETIKAETCKILHWDTYKYAAFQYEMGLLWLKLEVKDRFIINQMERSRIFWNWWKHQWYHRDQVFLSHRSLGCMLTLSTRLQIYHDLHDPHKLIADGYLDHSYAQIINLIAHESKKDKGD